VRKGKRRQPVLLKKFAHWCWLAQATVPTWAFAIFALDSTTSLPSMVDVGPLELTHPHRPGEALEFVAVLERQSLPDVVEADANLLTVRLVRLYTGP